MPDARPAGAPTHCPAHRRPLAWDLNSGPAVATCPAGHRYVHDDGAMRELAADGA